MRAHDDARGERFRIRVFTLRGRHWSHGPPGNHASAIKMVHMQNGVFGATAKCEDVCAFLDANRFDGAENRCNHSERETVPLTIRAKKTAIVMVDWQLDFTSPKGFGAALGNDCEVLREEALPNAVKILEAGREAKCAIVHTLEAHKADLSDCPPSKIRRCDKIGQTVDAKMGRILVRNEPGNSIEPLVAPIEGELIVHKPGKGAFYNTNLEFQLKRRGIETLIFTGVTTEVCVQTSMREANDRGFECIVADDATESYFPEFKKACLEMISSQNGIVGWRCLTKGVRTHENMRNLQHITYKSSTDHALTHASNKCQTPSTALS